MYSFIDLILHFVIAGCLIGTSVSYLLWLKSIIKNAIEIEAMVVDVFKGLRTREDSTCEILYVVNGRTYKSEMDILGAKEGDTVIVWYHKDKPQKVIEKGKYHIPYAYFLIGLCTLLGGFIVVHGIISYFS